MSSTTICVDTSSKPASHPRVPSNTPSHRLLYRGALSLPDSHLLLDGLSFAAMLGDARDVANLLNNPLALALESMRGRPSLHLLGTARLADIWIDTAGAVGVDVHPHAVLTRIYFENVLCLNPTASADGTTAHGIRVSLSASNDPGTDILIYGARAPTLQLRAARILPAPPPARAPRPDDPTPRHPPQKRRRSPSPRAAAKRAKAMDDAEAVRRAREVMLRLPRGGGAVFKVPSVPARAREGAGEIEVANKAVVKRAAVRCLAARGVGRADPEFNELFQLLYRGTSFALRRTMRAEPVDVRAVDALLDTHAGMYVLDGRNRAMATSDPQSPRLPPSRLGGGARADVRHAVDDGSTNQEDSDDEHMLSAMGDVSLAAEYRPPSPTSGSVSLRPKVRRPPMPSKRPSGLPRPREDDDGLSYSHALLRSHLRSPSDASPRTDFTALVDALRAARPADPGHRGSFFSDTAPAGGPPVRPPPEAPAGSSQSSGSRSTTRALRGAPTASSSRPRAAKPSPSRSHRAPIPRSDD